MLGGWLSFLIKDNKATISSYLSFSAGILLGITLFHFLPESMNGASLPISGTLIALGFVLPIVFQRKTEQDSHQFVSVVSLIVFSLHAFFDGFLIDLSAATNVGLIVVISIVLHRLPVAFSLYTIVKTHAHRKQEIFTYFGIFVLMTPLGIILSDFALRDAFAPYWPEISAFTIGMFVYIGLYHLLIEHKLLRKENAVQIATGFLIPLALMFVH